MTTRVTFSSDSLKLEGLLDMERPADIGAVVAHPHPLYGGNMVNPVVSAIAEVYHQKGIATLRFNFRGVGASQGSYNDGIGEVADILSAAAFLMDQGIRRVEFAGYSFGTWVMAKLPIDASWMGRMIMISPPVAFMDMPATLRLPNLHLVVTGGMDDIAPPEIVKNRLPHWNPEATLEVIGGADHFYAPGLGKLRGILTDYL